MDYTVYADSRNLSHEEWLELRKQGIGGSDAGAIMGVHPYKGAFGVWADKKGYSEAVEDNEAMRQGRDLEDYVARRFAEKTGLTVRREYGMMRSREVSVPSGASAALTAVSVTVGVTNARVPSKVSSLPSTSAAA